MKSPISLWLNNKNSVLKINFQEHDFFSFENKRTQVVTKENLLDSITWSDITEKLTRQKILKTGIAFSKQTGHKKYN